MNAWGAVVYQLQNAVGTVDDGCAGAPSQYCGKEPGNLNVGTGCKPVRHHNGVGLNKPGLLL
jgi:hypothetical protein